MSKKIRLIARLDVKDTNLVKGIQLEGLRKLGDPNAFAKEYYEAGIDELLYIDIVASLYNRNNLSDIVRKTVDDVYIPVCVGGGLRSVEDVRHILSMGADKAAINTAAIKRPELITEVAEAFGSQCMVLSIQAKRSRTWPGKWEAYYDNGRAHGERDAHAKRLDAGGKEFLRIDTHDHSPRHMPRITMPTMIPRRMVATVKARRYPAHISKSTSSSPPSASGSRSQSFFRYPDGRA